MPRRGCRPLGSQRRIRRDASRYRRFRGCPRSRRTLSGGPPASSARAVSVTGANQVREDGRNRHEEGTYAEGRDGLGGRGESAASANPAGARRARRAAREGLRSANKPPGPTIASSVGATCSCTPTAGVALSCPSPRAERRGRRRCRCPGRDGSRSRFPQRRHVTVDEAHLEVCFVHALAGTAQRLVDDVDGGHLPAPLRELGRPTPRCRCRDRAPGRTAARTRPPREPSAPRACRRRADVRRSRRAGSRVHRDAAVSAP